MILMYDTYSHRGGGVVTSPGGTDTGSGDVRGGGVITSPGSQNQDVAQDVAQEATQGSNVWKIVVFMFILVAFAGASWWIWKKV